MTATLRRANLSSGMFLCSAVLLMTSLAPSPHAGAQMFTSGSTGADGPLNPTQNVVRPLPPTGILNFTTITIPRGVTVRFQANAGNTPAFLLATGDVLIEGAIDVSGPGSLPGGPSGGSGMGPGGGRAGGSASGGGGGFGTAGRNGIGPRGGAGGGTYGQSLPSLVGGSGGGGGGNALASTGGGAGGRGGGAILIATAGTLTINGGTIDARGMRGAGGAAGSFASGESGGGGGGAGGAILLRATTVAGRDWRLLAQGGVGGPGSRGQAHGGEGGAGHVRVESFRSLVQDNAPWGATPQGSFPPNLTAGQPNLADQQKLLAANTPVPGSSLPLPATPPGARQGCAPVINEILTGTAATGTEEFVEIFNPCQAAVSLDGWRLVYRSATNTTPATSTDSSPLFTLQGVLPPGGYVVFGGPGYHGPSSGALQSGIAANGAVGLRDRDLRLIDSVGFGPVPGNAFVEGTPAPAAPVSPTPGLSISRTPDGADTNDNSRDFVVTPPTPMGANARTGLGPATAPPSVPPVSGSTTPLQGQFPASAPQPLSPFLDSTGVLYACLNPNGQLRPVPPTTPCASGEVKIHWPVVPDLPKP